MRDEVRFTAPWGVLGRVLARRHLKEFLKERNAEIKRVAESEEWHKYLDGGVVGRMAAMWDAPVNGWNRPTLVRASPEIVLPHKHAS